ncbi:MAG: GNAT family N-acetyltransferase [Pyrinomonadaceae bacterium]
MEPTFRQADASHADLLIELMREFYLIEHLPFDESVARRALPHILDHRAHGLIFLIELAEKVAGYVVLTFGFSLEFHGRDALVDELYVRESFRGQGIGQTTLRFIEAACRSESVEAVHLEVDHANTRAQSLYRRAGYQDHQRYLLTKWLT